MYKLSESKNAPQDERKSAPNNQKHTKCIHDEYYTIAYPHAWNLA